MPRVEIPGVGIVQFPDNMPQDQIMSRAEAMQNQAKQPLLDPRELGIGQLVSGGFSRGIESLKGTAFDLIPALGASMIGKDAYAKEQLQEYKDRMAAQEELTPTAFKTYKDIGGVGDAFSFAAETLGEIGPDIASFMLGAGVGTVAGKTIAKKSLESTIKKEAAEFAAKREITGEAKDKLAETMLRRAKEGAAGQRAAEIGANVGLQTGLWGTSLGVNIPDVFNSIYENTGSLEPGIALTIGSLVGALDTYLPSKILKQLGPKGKERIAKMMADKSELIPVNFKRAFVGQVFGTAGGEALTEAAQEALTLVGSQLAGDKDPFFSQENIDNIITASLKGFIGGGTIGAPGGALEAKRMKDERARQIAARDALLQQQQEQQVPGAAPVSEPLTLEQEAAMRREERQLAAQQQIYGDLFGEPVPTGTRGAPTFPVGAPPIEEGIPARPAKTAAAQQELDLGMAPVQGELALEQPAEVTPAPVEFNTVLDADILKGTGLKPQSGFYKRLLGKDIADPAQQQEVAQVLSDVRSNPNLSDSTKEATERVAMQAFNALAEQTEMLGPRGGILQGADYGRVQPESPVSEADRESVQVPSEPVRAEPTAGVGEPGQERMAPAGVPPSELRDGEAVQPSTLETTPELTQEEQDAIQAELAAELGTEVPPAPTQELVQVAGTEAAPKRGRQRGIEGTTQAVPTALTEPFTEVTNTQKPKAKAAPKAAKPVKEKAPEGTAEFQELGRPSKTDFNRFLGRGYMSFAKEDITDIDDNIKVTNLLNNRGMLNANTTAAKVYFSKMPRIVDNMLNIAHDLAFDTRRFRNEGESTSETQFFNGMNGKNARLAADWVEKNLSKETDKKFRDFVRGFERARDAYTDRQLMALLMSGLTGTKEKASDETTQSYLDGQIEDLARARNRAERRAATGVTRGEGIALDEEIRSANLKKITESAVFQIGQPLHPAIISAIRQGDLQSALALLAASSDRFVSRIATRLAEALGDTNVVIRENLVDEAGVAVPGYYDPKTDTIYIDANTGMNSHVLLHEVGHAVMSHVLSNPNNPLTRQLQQLFDLIKDSLGTAYGSTSLDEFAAEAQSNPEFVGLLKSINPNGGKYTAWDRFVRAVSNFFRRMIGLENRPLESAFDEADRIIAAIISPAPEFRDAGALFVSANAGTAGPVLDRLGAAIEALPGMTPERADNVHEFLKNTVGGNFRNFMLSLLPLNALADIASQKGLKEAPTMDRLVNERHGFEYKMNRSIEPLVERAEKFAKTNSRQQVDLFNEVVYESTINKVDPTKDRTDYETPELQKEYDRVKAMYDKLYANGKALYTGMRDAYKGMYEEILKSIGERIDASVTDPDRARLIKRDIFDRLTAKGNIDPYFPLARYGKYWVSYNARDASGQMEKYVEAFETERERERNIAQMTQDGATDIEKFSKLSELNYRRVPTGSFVNSVLQIMELNNVPAEATEEVMRLFLSTLPETSFAQSFQKRKETLGFKKDAVRALREKMYRTSHQIASMRYAAKLNAVLDQMRKYARSVGKGTGEEAQRDNRVINEYVKEFEKRINYINNPTVDKWAQVATSLGFNMTLGFNVSSAVINLTQVPLILTPYLAGKYGMPATMKAIGDAYKVHLNSGFKQEVEVFGAKGDMVKQKAMPALDNYNFDDPKLPASVRRLKTLSRVASEQGQLNRSQLYDILEVDDRKNPLSKVNAASGFVFHHGERLNRQVSLIAAYNLDLDRLNSEKATKAEKALSQQEKEELAANNAIYTTEMTNGGIAAASAPRIAQSSLGKVLFMFKRYGVSMYYMLFKTAREALKNEDPEVRKAAMRQIAGIYGTAALFAGAQGLPLFGIAAMVYNLFADDDEDDFETATRKSLGEFAYKGLFNYVTNVEIASRTGLSDLIIRDSGKQDSQTVALTMMEMMGGPVYGVASKVERGLNMIREGNVQRGIENILPTSLGNVMKGVRYATEGTRTLRGDPITGEVNGWNIAAQAFGFAPADYARQLEINSRLKGIDKQVNTEQSKLKRQYFVASRLGDQEEMNDIRDKLIELGNKHPGLEISAATINDVLDRSIKAQERTTKRMINGVAYSPKMLKEIEEHIRDYEGR
jgi:predicted kinase